MRIFYVTEAHGWSGGAVQALQMAKALTSRGHSLTLACTPGSEIAARAQKAGLAVELLPLRQDYDVLSAGRIVSLMKKTGSEILHAQHPKSHAISLIAASFMKRPVFIASRRVLFPLHRNPFSRIKYLSSRIDGYVAVSEAVRRELIGAGVKAAKVEVIPSAVEPIELSAEDGRSVRAELGLTDEPLVGHIANYASFKGQDVLVAAIPAILAAHPRAKFLFAGRGTEALAERIRAVGLEKHVFVLGFRRDVPRLLAALSVFAFPSLEEAAGTALREGMVAGLPVVGSRVGGIPESIEDGQTGLLVPGGDSTALAQAINRMLADPDAARQMASRGQAFARGAFLIDAACLRMERFYERLVAARRGIV